MNVSYVGWERWKLEHPELLYTLASLDPARLKAVEQRAQADLRRNLFLLEILANQKVER